MTTGGLFSLVVLGLIGAFLLYRGFEIFSDFGFSFITGEVWNIGDPMDTSTAVLGIGAMLMGSVITSVIAIVIAVPCAIAVALFIEFYSPRKLRLILTAVLDLVAAIPSVIFGIWGYAVLLKIGLCRLSVGLISFPSLVFRPAFLEGRRFWLAYFLH